MVVKAGVHKPMGDVTDATSIFYTVYDYHQFITPAAINSPIALVIASGPADVCGSFIPDVDGRQCERCRHISPGT